MQDYSTFSELIEDWPRGAAGLANDLDERAGTVRAWKRNNSIPSEHWEKLVALAPDRRRKISPELLLSLAARSRSAGKAA